MKYFITSSPWPTRIPNDTEIVPCEAPTGQDSNGNGNWFQTADGIDHFEDDPSSVDGKFKLFNHEFIQIED